MNWRTTAVLFVILAAIVGYLVWDGRQEETAVSTPTAESALPPTPARVSLLATTPDQISKLAISDLQAGNEIVYEQVTPSTWEQTSPEASVVISGTMNTAVAGIANLSSSRSLSADNPLSDFGLDTPVYQIEITYTDSDRTLISRLLIGNLTPTGNAYYAQKEGDGRIHLLPNGLIDNILSLLNSPPIEES